MTVRLKRRVYFSSQKKYQRTIRQTTINKKPSNLLFTIISEGKDLNELNEKEDIVYNKNGIVIIDQEIEDNKKMILQDIKGDALKGEQLIITEAGLERSLRKLRDGYTYFGINKVRNCK